MQGSIQEILLQRLNLLNVEKRQLLVDKVLRHLKTNAYYESRAIPHRTRYYYIWTLHNLLNDKYNYLFDVATANTTTNVKQEQIINSLSSDRFHDFVIINRCRQTRIIRALLIRHLLNPRPLSRKKILSLCVDRSQIMNMKFHMGLIVERFGFWRLLRKIMLFRNWEYEKIYLLLFYRNHNDSINLIKKWALDHKKTRRRRICRALIRRYCE